MNIQRFGEEVRERAEGKRSTKKKDKERQKRPEGREGERERGMKRVGIYIIEGRERGGETEGDISRDLSREISRDLSRSLERWRHIREDVNAAVYIRGVYEVLSWRRP